jgi:hypothetical protein
MTIEPIQCAIAAGHIRVTEHADEEMVADGLSLDEVLRVMQMGEIVEAYPSDRPLPSCLILGQNQAGASIHCVWAYNESNGLAVLITVYRVDPQRWIEGRTRKK